MATKTLYVLSSGVGLAASPNFWSILQDGGTAPTAANTVYGWVPAKQSTGKPYFQAFLGASAAASTTTTQTTTYIGVTSAPTKGTGNTNTTSGDSFATPSAYSGVFAAGAWTLNLMLRASTAGAIGHLNLRVWASVNADGSSARELTSGSLVGTAVTLSTTADVNGMGTTTWSPGAITLVNEYMFFQVEWQETTGGSSNSDNVLFRAGTCLVTTTNFSPIQFLSAAFVGGTPASSFAALLHMDGTTASTTFTDVGGSHTVTAYANAQVNNTTTKFSGSLSVANTSPGSTQSTVDHIEIAQATDLTVSAGAFSVDCWVNVTTLPTPGNTATIVDAYSSFTGWILYVDTTGAIIFGNTSLPLATGTGAITTGGWHHLVGERDGSGTARIWVDGVFKTSGSDTSTYDLSQPINIGCSQNFSTYQAPFKGYVDELRIIKGSTPYTTQYGSGNFTPPSAPYTLPGIANATILSAGPQAWQGSATLAGVSTLTVDATVLSAPGSTMTRRRVF